MESDIYNVIIRPLVTEKGTRDSQLLNAYAFEVNHGANKAQIKQAIEKIYSVKVLEVRTANRRGKPRRYGYRSVGATRQWKKAVVVLHPDHHIDLF
jgi:large subunit ribosomal protein L23